MTSVAAPLDSGTAVGPYVVERQLAQGGMSVLYVARDSRGPGETGSGGRVVLKMVLPDVATTATRARLLREARALSLVDHPGVVRVHGTGEHDGMPWIAMDLVLGTDLKHVIAEQGHLPINDALKYAVQAAEALVAAHDAGVVHRDLKPSNVLLTPERRIVLVDFGIAKRRADAREGDVLTSAREVLGTPAYLSPEQLDHGLADERSDIWALGCLLYEMVVGVPPFGRGGSATTAAILRDEPLFPSYVTGDVAHIISACLRKNSFARVASPRELLALLRDAVGSTRGLEIPSAERPSSSTRPASPRSTARVSTLPPPNDLIWPSTPPSRPGASARRSASSRAPALSSPSRSPSIPLPSRSPSIPLPSRSPSIPLPSRPPSIPAPSPTSVPRAVPSSRAPAPVTRSSQAPAVVGRSRSTAPPAMPSATIAPATARGRIKGTAIRAATAWFVDTYGETAMERVIERCAPGSKPRVRDPAFGVMASGWYDIQLVGEFVRALEQVAAPRNPAEFTRLLGAAIARDNVGGVYRALFRLVASPQLLEANAQRVWQTYCDEGTLQVRPTVPGAGSFEASIRGWTHHHEAVCRLFSPVAEQALRLLGFGEVTVERRSCIGQGGAQCAFYGAGSL